MALNTIAIILLVAFGPPMLFAMSIARAKRYRREPAHAVRKAFLWGAFGAAAIALVVNTLASGTIVRPYLRHDGLAQLVLAVVVAPIVEETAKPAVLYMGQVRRHTDERVDGLIYGAVAGLGFSATENLFYELAALASGGQGSYIVTAVLRTFSSTLLHATATALTGYGIARHLTSRSAFGFLHVVPFFLLAVLLHAAFNFIASIALAYSVLALVVVSVWGFLSVRKNIHRLSLVAPHGRWDPVGPHQSVAPHPGGSPRPREWRVVRDPEDEGPRSWDPPRYR